MSDTLHSTKKFSFYDYISTLGYLPRWVILFIDILLSASAYFFSFVVVEGLLGYADTAPRVDQLFVSMGVLLFIQIIAFLVCKTNYGILRYSGFADAIRLINSIVLAGATFFLLNTLLVRLYGTSLYNTAVLILYVCVSFVLLFGLRLLVKTMFEFVRHNQPHIKRVAIYGTNAPGIAIAKVLRSSIDDRFRAVAFINDEPKLSQHAILGLKVLQKEASVVAALQKLRVQGVVVSPLKMEEINPATDLDIFLNNDIQIFSAGSISTWNSEVGEERMQYKKIKSIQIEELLERPVISLDQEQLGAQITKKIVMVTGAAGSIGGEIVSQVIKYKPQLLILVDQAESPLHETYLRLLDRYPNQLFSARVADVRNYERLESILIQFRPHIIYHAAAYKHVPLMEDNPTESIEVNVGGTKNLADLAVKHKVERFVMISTDKAVNPTNIMGASKRIAEIYVQSLFKKLQQENPNCTKFITTRFGNVLGSNGSVIPFFKKQIENGGPVTVTHPEIVRYFMTIPEACSLVLEAGNIGEGGEIFVFDMGEQIKILDLAKKMIRLAGYKPGVDIKITFTGLRPGEKLYEELLHNEETTLPTPNPKIVIAKVAEFEYDQVNKEIKELFRLSKASKEYLLVAQMKKIVPEFVSRNSPYEKLDD